MFFVENTVDKNISKKYLSIFRNVSVFQKFNNKIIFELNGYFETFLATVSMWTVFSSASKRFVCFAAFFIVEPLT